jgi:hypothetical protein
MNLRRATGGLGLGAVLTFGLVHAIHVAVVSAAPAAVAAAVSFVCRIH